MDNKKFIEIINKYQSNNYIHELTCICGAGALDPVEKNGKVILKCKSCPYEQEISEFLTSMILQMYNYDPFGFGTIQQ
jgi:hypothetical protein